MKSVNTSEMRSVNGGAFLTGTLIILSGIYGATLFGGLAVSYVMSKAANK